MTSTTRNRLYSNLTSITERLESMFDALDASLPYFDTKPELPLGGESWDHEGNILDDEGDALEDEDGNIPNVRDLEGGQDAYDAISEYPLEVIDERGMDFAVVITTGGPYVEITAKGSSTARLVGYWGSERIDMGPDDLYDRFLDFFIER